MGLLEDSHFDTEELIPTPPLLVRIAYATHRLVGARPVRENSCGNLNRRFAPRSCSPATQARARLRQEVASRHQYTTVPRIELHERCWTKRNESSMG